MGAPCVLAWRSSEAARMTKRDSEMSSSSKRFAGRAGAELRRELLVASLPQVGLVGVKVPDAAGSGGTCGGAPDECREASELHAGSPARRAGWLTRGAVEEPRDRPLAIRRLVTYAGIVCVYGAEAVDADVVDNPL